MERGDIVKYKVYGILACIAVILCSFLAVYAKSGDTRRYHQHIEAEKKEPCTDHGEDTFCTHLPLVQIDTGGEEIPGKPIFNKYGRSLSYTVSKKGEEDIIAEMKVTDHETENNHISDAPSVESKIRIHVRGNSSRAFDKSG